MSYFIYVYILIYTLCIYNTYSSHVFPLSFPEAYSDDLDTNF